MGAFSSQQCGQDRTTFTSCRRRCHSCRSACLCPYCSACDPRGRACSGNDNGGVHAGIINGFSVSSRSSPDTSSRAGHNSADINADPYTNTSTSRSASGSLDTGACANIGTRSSTRCCCRSCLYTHTNHGPGNSSGACARRHVLQSRR